LPHGSKPIAIAIGTVNSAQRGWAGLTDRWCLRKYRVENKQQSAARKGANGADDMPVR
jgi:hypothetical protein